MTAPEVSGFGDLREIGRGGYSRVYEALEFEFDRLVAIKVLNEPIKDGNTAAAFERECRTMGRLVHHPNIVTIIKSAFTTDDQPCIVMELFHEGSYFQMMRDAGPIEIGEVLRVGVKLAGALATAHEAGILHGDVKPHNVFRSRFGEPALGDFGIATLVSRHSGRLPRGFSVHYAAPDLVDGMPSAVSDQYSLAATLYTMAFGRRPFEPPDSAASEPSEETLLRVLRDPVPRLPNQFPGALAGALWRAMAKDPDYRFESLQEFAAELNAAEAELGLAVTALPADRGMQPSTVTSNWTEGNSLTEEPTSVDEYSLHATAASSMGLQEPETKVFEETAVAGSIVLSDGREERLDAELIIGRRPESEPLQPNERAVVHGAADRAVSRRHFEVSLEDGNVMARLLGRSAVVERSDGSIKVLTTGSSVTLQQGDALHYGSECWLRSGDNSQSG